MDDNETADEAELEVEATVEAADVDPAVLRRARRRSAAQTRETAVSADSGRARGQQVDTGGQVHFFTGREFR